MVDFVEAKGFQATFKCGGAGSREPCPNDFDTHNDGCLLIILLQAILFPGRWSWWRLVYEWFRLRVYGLQFLAFKAGMVCIKMGAPELMVYEGTHRLGRSAVEKAVIVFIRIPIFPDNPFVRGNFKKTALLARCNQGITIF